MDDSSKIYVRKSSGLIRSVSPSQALYSNIVAMGLMGPVLYVLYAVGTSPNGDLPVTVLVGLGVTLAIAYVYWMFATAFPRTGGDYIYTSRILHPGVGFFESFIVFFVAITSAVSYDVYLGVTTGFSYMFINFGYLTGNSSLISTGISLATNTTLILVISLIGMALIILLMLQSTKTIMRVVQVMFFISLIVFVVYIGLLIYNGPAGFQHNFSSVTGYSYQNLVNQGLNVAKQNSITYSYTAFGTLFTGLYFVMLSFIGYATSSYYAGEVSGNPFRSQGIAIFGSAVLYGIALLAVYFFQFYTYGHHFLVSMVSIFYYSPSTYPAFGGLGTTAMPSGVFLVNYLTGNPYLAALIPFGLGVQFMLWGIIYYLYPTRYIFAWSFDRILPVKLSNTNKKGVPTWAVLIFGILSIIFLFLAVYTPILSFYAYEEFGFYLAIDILLVAGLVFPFRKKEIFENSHKMVKLRVLGIPVISIISAIGLIFSTITMVSVVLPVVTGFPINLSYFIPVVGAMLFAIILYIVSYYYHKSKGLPVELIGKEIPPL